MLKQLFIPFRFYKYLLAQLITREIKARYKQSFIGYAWIIINPLMQLIVFSFVFSVIFRYSGSDVPYPIFLFSGLLPWIYFQTSLNASTLCLVDNSELIKKVNFPREVLPYSVVSAKLIDFLFASSMFLLFMIYYRIPFQDTMVYVIPLLLIQIILMTGLGMIFAAFNLYYRDIQYLINLLLMLWLYLSPIIYPLSLVPQKYIWLYKLNPMVGIIEGYRSALFNKTFDYNTIMWSTVTSFIVFIVGYLIFKQMEKTFADII